MKQFNRRQIVKTASSLFAIGVTAGSVTRAFAQDTVKLGLLHSLSGTIAIAEASLVDAEKMAIEEINAAGGVMGKKIEVVVEDGASENSVFAEKARKLIERDKVAAIIGCYTSASRKAVLPVLNQTKGLLFYPTYYEGQEEDKHVFYTSQEATQSVISAINWLAKEKGKSFFLVGSDYIYPRTCNKIAKPTIAKAGGKVVGEEYAPLGHTEFSSLQCGILQATARRGPGRHEAGLAVDRGLGKRNRRHWQGQRRRVLRLHGVFPEHQVTGQREVRQGVQGQVWAGARHRRPDAVRLQQRLPVENDGREGQVL
jgi:hypothetical protein